jgi:hypothetical protein
MRQAFVAVLLICFASGAFAQSTNASVAGRITDPSNAVIVDATVAGINAETNVRHETATNSSGDYRLTNLPPGTYRIEVDKPGFKKVIKPEVILHVQDALGLDFAMMLGAVSETTTVEGGAPLVNTQSATVSTVIDRQFVDTLPLNGRSFQALIMLTPGVVVTPTSFNNQGQFSVNGQRSDANYFTVDGVSANLGVTGYFPMGQSGSGALPALSAAGGTNSLVSVDAMQEFRIQTSSFAPEFGRTPGGQIAIATRSGTNSVHGSVFEYFRHDAMDAKDWFVNLNGLPKPETRQHDFGGVAGGPIVRNKTFFFVSYEGLRLRQPSTVLSSVPDAASRQEAPAAVRAFLNAFPLPNGPARGPGLAEFHASFSNPSTLDASSLRVDHVAGSKLTLFGRYNYSPSSFEQRGGSFSSGPVLSARNVVSSALRTLTIGATHLIGRTVSHELRVNYSRHEFGSGYEMDDFGGAVPLPESLVLPPGYSLADSAFLFVITGAGQYAMGKFGVDEQRQVNLVDNVSIVRGSHQLKAGVDYRWLAPSSSPFAYRNFVQFTGVNAAPGGALSGTAAFAQPAAFQDNALRSHNVSLYGQDTWTVARRLTVTYGLRWDVNPPLRGLDEGSAPFTVVGLEQPATLRLAPRGTPLYDTTYGNVAPRFGVAYQLSDSPTRQSVIRGGAGTFYDLGHGSMGGVTSFFPYSASKAIASPVPFPMSQQDMAPPPITTSLPINTIVVADPRLKLPRTYQWNVALEQSIGGSQSVSLTYLGARGRDLLRVTQLFNPNPDFQAVIVTDNSASSDHHALQLKFDRRLSRGVQGMASYTLAHSTDNSSTDSVNYRPTPGAAGTNADHADSDFDIRHAFTAGVTYVLPATGSSTFTRAVLNGWSIDALVLARSAPPVDVLGPIMFAGGTALASRPNVNSGVPLELFGREYPGGKRLNPAAFTAAPPGQQGNFGRNVLRGFAASQADVVVQRQFQLAGKSRLRFRAECFNVFNQPNFGTPVNTITSPFFGRAAQTLANSLGPGGANGGFSPLYQIGGPRSIQLALRLEF